MEGVPAGMGDWGVRGVLLESERLLNKHLRDFLPIILVFIFPAALIRVLHTQFFKADYVGPPVLQIPFPTNSVFSFQLGCRTVTCVADCAGLLLSRSDIIFAPTASQFTLDITAHHCLIHHGSSSEGHDLHHRLES